MRPELEGRGISTSIAQQFAAMTTVSHRIVTGLGHSALKESEVTE